MAEYEKIVFRFGYGYVAPMSIARSVYEIATGKAKRDYSGIYFALAVASIIFILG